MVPDHPSLSETGASFVTLNRQGHLRGCIGTLAARRPLRDDVHHNAVAAAFRDPRFPPLSAEEFGDLEIEVSLLSEPERMSFRDETDALGAAAPRDRRRDPGEAAPTRRPSCRRCGKAFPIRAIS